MFNPVSYVKLLKSRRHNTERACVVCIGCLVSVEVTQISSIVSDGYGQAFSSILID